MERSRDNWIDVVTEDWLRSNSIRGAYFSANVLHKGGVFGHEVEGKVGDGEPFVIMQSLSKVLPTFWSGDHQEVYDFLENQFSQEGFDRDLLAECKATMDYTACVQYIKGNSGTFNPMIRGVTKARYRQLLKRL